MDKVTYTLGAGFSAPLGLPVMSNFVERSKDLYFNDQEKFRNFPTVFEQIRQMSVIKNYFSSNLFNIEEILSILEMKAFLEGASLDSQFKDYICDVINAYTPENFKSEKNIYANWQSNVFGRKSNRKYICFVASLLRLKYQLHEKKADINNPVGSSKVKAVVDEDITTKYQVVSLNYDLVLERIANEIKAYNGQDEVYFERHQKSDWERTSLVKLHGCAKERNIVPPTWAKGTHPEIAPEWKRAYSIFSEANHLRILGYSLPLADSYVKYLLKSAITENEHLKSVDVICLDPDGATQNRYEQFFKFQNFRFKNDSMENYLKYIFDKTMATFIAKKEVSANQLELAHISYMDDET